MSRAEVFDLGLAIVAASIPFAFSVGIVLTTDISTPAEPGGTSNHADH